MANTVVLQSFRNALPNFSSYVAVSKCERFDGSASCESFNKQQPSSTTQVESRQVYMACHSVMCNVVENKLWVLLILVLILVLILFLILFHPGRIVVRPELVYKSL